VLHAVYSFCLLQWTIPLNSVSKWLFFLIFLDIQVFVGSVRVLEKFLWGPGKSWKSPGFFFSKRVGTLDMPSIAGLSSCLIDFTHFTLIRVALTYVIDYSDSSYLNDYFNNY